MNILKFMGKALLIVVLPIVFLVVTTTIFNFFIAIIGNLSGAGSITECFYGLFKVGITTFIVFVVTLIGTIYYLTQKA